MLLSHRRLLTSLLGAALCLFLAVPASFAISPSALGSTLPDAVVIDEAEVFSRASRAELEAKLKSFSDDRVDARLITVRRLDYGFSLSAFGDELLETWNSPSGNPLLLMLIETQNKRAALIADDELQTQLPASLLTSTARTTMTIPLREGDRYRQASIDGLNRLGTVLSGGDDPGPPQVIERVTLPTNIPTRAETESSNATTWVIVLLILGTIIPMATWWVFSR
ncbi:MAG: methanol dehydrogenase [Synechococcus sp. MED650]|nr:methanol dehydrogenase [Synechococcus sp. MED650]OUW54343.1 MAG: methanol dehydrogenase [Cyanobacteria bacterium TMED188]